MYVQPQPSGRVRSPSLTHTHTHTPIWSRLLFIVYLES